MKPGDLRQFKDSKRARDLGSSRAGRTFMVLRVGELVEQTARYCVVDILLDGVLEEGLGYFWVEDSSEALNAAG